MKKLLQFLFGWIRKPKSGAKRRQSWSLWWQRHLPQHALSRFMGFWADLENPRWFKNWAIRRFVKRYKVDLTDAQAADIITYPSFNAFFTRRLKAETRPIATAGVACPVDGTVSQVGAITGDKIIQAKDMTYDVLGLLGGREQTAKAFQEGQFATFYLSPKDYHRVHMPLDGKLQEMIHVPGELFSVNRTAVNYEPQVFARNERVVSIFETAKGPMAVVMVGAMIVGSIQTVWCGEVTPPRGYEVYSWPYTKAAPALTKGDEMGHFQVGSTVIVLFGKGAITWEANLQPEVAVKYGQLIAS